MYIEAKKLRAKYRKLLSRINKQIAQIRYNKEKMASKYTFCKILIDR